MSPRSRKPAAAPALLSDQALLAPEYDEYVETRIIATPRPRDADASFLDGLIFGALTGAALVLAISPPVRAQVQRLAQQLGLTPAGARPEPPDAALPSVAPPPDPLSSSPAPPAAT